MAAWSEAGFGVDAAGGDDEGVCRVGGVDVRLIGRDGAGIVGWSLAGLPPGVDDVDGIPTSRARATPGPAGTHPNGVTTIDHVVVLTPDVERTVGALTDIGVPPRRERDGQLGGRAIRQVFFRFEDVIIEVVGSPHTTGDGPATLWGITYVVADVDASAAFFGAATSPVKDAVQPGRRITTLNHRELGMSVRSALISGPILVG